MKFCIKCNIEKNIIDFHKVKRNYDGLHSYCKECNKATRKQNYNENKERNYLYHKNYIKNISKEKLKEYRKTSYNNHRKERIEKTTIYKQNKRNSDSLFRLQGNLMNRLYSSLKNKKWNKISRFTKSVGCSLDDLKFHIQIQFQPGMTWENYGEWHIDHILPLSSAKTEQELYTLCHYTNLQPLWAKDNLKKSDKVA